MVANGTSELKWTSSDGKTLAILCPRLRMENRCAWVRPDWIRFATDIVTLRAECGSPLKVFTLFEFWRKPRRKFELIGRDRSFTMKESVLADGDEKF